MNILKQFASEATSAQSGGDIFTTLGIDWKTLLLQIVAFLILVWLLGKFVYPILMKSVDKRQDDIESATRAAEDAKKQAQDAEKNIAKLLKTAQDQASDVVSTAKQEAVATMEAAEKKAKKQAESILAGAKTQIEHDVIAARKAIHNDTIDLVAMATGKIIGKVVDDNLDEKLIKQSIEEVS